MSDWRYRATVYIHICRLNIEFIEDLSECECFEIYVHPALLSQCTANSKTEYVDVRDEASR